MVNKLLKCKENNHFLYHKPTQKIFTVPANEQTNIADKQIFFLQQPLIFAPLKIKKWIPDIYNI
jgi:hypothetical protein